MLSRKKLFRDKNNNLSNSKKKNEDKCGRNTPNSKILFLNNNFYRKLLKNIFFLLFSIGLYFIIYSIFNKKKNNFLFEIVSFIKNAFFKGEEYIEEKSGVYEKTNYNFENYTFIILAKNDCQNCGFFYYFINYIGCVIHSITSQRIPIIDLSSFTNVFNKFDPNDESLNPWEIFFIQPYNLSMKEVKEKAKIIEYSDCPTTLVTPNFKDIYSNKYSLNFYHDFITKYMPLKQEIYDEVNIIKNKLFGNSENILGVLARGTDYITLKPKGFPIPPKAEEMIEDAKKMNNENNYDFIFLATEDNIIKEKFKNEFGEKIKFLEMPRNIEYNYNGTEYYSSKKNAQGIGFQKIYLFNIIILSQCIDVISARTYGAAAAFILSEKGFRNSLVYNLSEY